MLTLRDLIHRITNAAVLARDMPIRTSGANPKNHNPIKHYFKPSAKGVTGRMQRDPFLIPIVAVIAFFSGFVPIGVFHETTHVLVCNAYGGEGRFTSLFSFTCLWGEVREVEILRFSGGAAATALALTPLAFWPRYKRHTLYRGLLIAFLTIAFREFETAILEPTYYDFYASATGGFIMLLIAFFAGIAFYFWLGRSKDIPEGWTSKKLISDGGNPS